MNRERARVLNSKIKSAYALTDATDLAPNHNAWLAEIMTIWSCAYLEHTFRTSVLEYSTQHSDSATASYVRNQIRRVRNPSVQRICEVLGHFDASWKERFKENAGDLMLDSITSIVQQRNRIAHGERTDGTAREVYAHFRQVKALGDVLAAVLAAQDAERRQNARSSRSGASGTASGFSRARAAEHGVGGEAESEESEREPDAGRRSGEEQPDPEPER